MAKAKKWKWLQMGFDFFNKKKQRKLRRTNNGAEKQLVYIKILSLSLKEEGYLIYEGVEDTIEEEIALEIEEDEEVIADVLKFLLKNKLMVEKVKEDDYAEYFLTEVPELLGGESESARRVRNFRKREKEKLENEQALQCNAKTLQEGLNVTECNVNETERNKNVTQSKSKREEEEEEEYIESRSRERRSPDYYSIKKLLLEELGFEEEAIIEIMKLVEKKKMTLEYVKEKVEVTEYCTKGGAFINSGYFYKALKENYASVEKRKEWEKKKEEAPSLKTRFHNFEESSRRDYSDEELNSFVTNRRKQTLIT